MKEFQLGYPLGMGLFLIQFPLEYRKKLSDGEILFVFYFFVVGEWDNMLQ